MDHLLAGLLAIGAAAMEQFGTLDCFRPEIESARSRAAYNAAFAGRSRHIKLPSKHRSSRRRR